MFPGNEKIHDYFSKSGKSISHQKFSLAIIKKHIPHIIHCFRRGTPLCTSEKKGSLTVEASLILPIFLCFFLFVLYFFQVFQIELEIKQALHRTARELAVYAYMEDTDGAMVQQEPVQSFVKSFGLHVLGTTASIQHNIQRKDIFQWIRGGRAGIICSMEEDGNYIVLRASYCIVLPVSCFGKQSFEMTNQVRYRKWTGYDFREDMYGQQMVYITPTGRVYHLNRECTHLRLSIRPVSNSELATLRNENGGKYHACEVCIKGTQGASVYYITEYGDRYHSSLECSGLKRTVLTIPLSEVGKRSCCLKCRTQH